MKISSYSFGDLTINNKKYQSDLVMLGDKLIEDRWWRKEGHLLQVDDIKPYLNDDLKTVIIGRGFSSRLNLDRKLQMFLLERKIVLQALSTPDACERYNEIKHNDLIAFFHLTC